MKTKTPNTTAVIIKALRAYLQKYAFDGNLYDRGLINSTWGKKCSEENKILRAEIARLEGTTTPPPQPAPKKHTSHSEADQLQMAFTKGEMHDPN
jgi:hypothetical protein